MSKSFINFHYLNLYRHNRNGHESVHEQNIVKKGILQDYKDLKTLLDNHSGTYLLNLSMHDKEMIEIFGEPNLIETYPRPTTNTSSGTREKWGCGYWWKF